MEIKELAEYSPVPLSEQMLVQLERDCELLLEWNEKINLTALRTRDDIYEKHFLDCLLPIALIGQNASVIDVGSGAGFPGVVFAAGSQSDAAGADRQARGLSAAAGQ